MQILNRLQSLLGEIYGVDLSQDVRDFVFSDAKLLAALCAQNERINKTEALLISQADEELHLSLYLDNDLLERLKKSDPTNRLNISNMNDFWAALEGISHFMYVVRSATDAKTVSLLELELQAEVDKFITSLYLTKRQTNQDLSRHLHELLFESTDFDPALEAVERKRYQDANYYASRYCWQLNQKFMSQGSGLVEELRQFYRLHHQAKIRYIDGGLYGGNA